MFCPKCGSINFRPKGVGSKAMKVCGGCGHKEKQTEEQEQIVIRESVEAPKKIEVIEKTDLRPKIRTKCEKCENKTAYYWTQQTRGADEPETRFFKCTKCNHTWREYA